MLFLCNMGDKVYVVIYLLVIACPMLIFCSPVVETCDSQAGLSLFCTVIYLFAPQSAFGFYPHLLQNITCSQVCHDLHALRIWQSEVA